MKVLMIEGRPSEHPIHRAYAESVSADFLYIDEFLKYQGKSENKFIMLLSWLLTSFYLVFNKKYNVFICGGPCPPLVFLKSLGLIRKKQMIISLAANETLFFLEQNKYSKFTKNLYYNWYNKTIDCIICIGGFQQRLAHQIITNKKIKVLKILNGLDKDFFNKAASFTYNPKGKDFICIANGPSGFRVYYKGIDLLIDVYIRYYNRIEQKGNLIIVGDWDKVTKEMLLDRAPKHIAERIIFTGKQASYIPYLNTVGLAVHFSRGDSFPTSTLETLALGIPTIVTENTGTSEIVKCINEDWVISEDIVMLEKEIHAFFLLSEGERVFLSDKAKRFMCSFKQEDSVSKFKELFERFCLSYDANR